MFVIFDLDGTLSNHDHRLHHVLESKDYTKYYDLCDQDPPHLPIIWTMIRLIDTGARVEIWTGRTDRVKEKTIDWLDNCSSNLSQYLTRMRQEGDFTPDFKLKGQWLQEELAAGNKPNLVFEDRPRMVEFWREQGIMCCDVGGR